jgi:site-specific recombinase XerD
MAKHPTGALFRNRHGKPWTRKSINNRFVRKKKRSLIAKDITAYAYRHTFVTEALASGVGEAAVRQLVGHRTTAMIANYTHLDAKPDYLRREALRAVTGSADPATLPPGSSASEAPAAGPASPPA